MAARTATRHSSIASDDAFWVRRIARCARVTTSSDSVAARDVEEGSPASSLLIGSRAANRSLRTESDRGGTAGMFREGLSLRAVIDFASARRRSRRSLYRAAADLSSFKPASRLLRCCSHF